MFRFPEESSRRGNRGLLITQISLIGAAWLAAATSQADAGAALARKPDGFSNSVGIKLVAIPAGRFLMGAPESEANSRIDERPVHEVQITKPFYLGAFE